MSSEGIAQLCSVGAEYGIWRIELNVDKSVSMKIKALWFIS